MVPNTRRRLGLSYRLDGDQGQVIVFLNNLFSPRRTWTRLVPQAAQHHRVLTYDLRNQGESGDAADGFGLQAHVDDLVSLLDTFDVEQAWLVGSSLSTLVCREFAVQHPGRAAGMILGGPAFGPFGGRRRTFFIKSWLQTLDSMGMGALFAQLYPLVLSDRTVQCHGITGFLALREAFIALHSSPARLARSLAAFQDIDERPDRLRAIECPVLLMAGDADFLAGASAVDTTSRLFRRGNHVILPGAGHLLYIDMPSRFGQVLLDFIGSHRPAQRRPG
jgi:pimeloyl-ACP methyl ester carboxylesterase